MDLIDFESVRRAIRERKTFKVLGDPAVPVELDRAVAEKGDEIVRMAIADAAFAPFHYDRKTDGLPEPFRFHAIWGRECREIAKRFSNWFPLAKPTNKLPSMLSVCGAVVLVTWLPDLDLDTELEKSRQINEEHLAAAAAAVQNLMLVLTARGYGTYWSSGGQFRLPEMFSKLDIPDRERLVAAVFVEYPQTMDLDIPRIPGKHRSRRSAIDGLVREVGPIPSE